MSLFRLTFLLFLMPSMALAVGEAARTVVRGGCPDGIGCCAFGKSTIVRTAPVFDSEDAIERIGTLKKGSVVEAQAGRVETEPGRLKLLQDFDEWKKGTVIGLYSEPVKDRKTRVGLSPRIIEADAPFLFEKQKCSPPSEDCWAKILSPPKVQWWIKVKFDERRSGWVNAKHFERVGDCS